MTEVDRFAGLQRFEGHVTAYVDIPHVLVVSLLPLGADASWRNVQVALPVSITPEDQAIAWDKAREVLTADFLARGVPLRWPTLEPAEAVHLWSSEGFRFVRGL